MKRAGGSVAPAFDNGAAGLGPATRFVEAASGHHRQGGSGRHLTAKRLSAGVGGRGGKAGLDQEARVPAVGHESRNSVNSGSGGSGGSYPTYLPDYFGCLAASPESLSWARAPLRMFTSA
jgi:hypothetical protein